MYISVKVRENGVEKVLRFWGDSATEAAQRFKTWKNRQDSHTEIISISGLISGIDKTSEVH